MLHSQQGPLGQIYRKESEQQILYLSFSVKCKCQITMSHTARQTEAVEHGSSLAGMTTTCSNKQPPLNWYNQYSNDIWEHQHFAI